MDSVVESHIIEHYKTRYLSSLDRLRRQSKLLLKENEYTWYYYSSFLWDSPEAYLTPKERLQHPSFISALNFMFEAEKELDLIQLDRLLSPSRELGDSSSLRFKEETKVLRLWCKWSKIFSKIKPLHKTYNIYH